MSTTVEAAKPKRVTQKRLSINLPAPVFDELQDLAEASHRTMTEIVRNAFTLAKIAYEETGQGNKITVTDRKGKRLKELVLM